jgi:NADH-quinone oxidoreductase subunit K
VLTLFVITIAAAEIGIGLAIVLLVFRARGSSDLDDLGILDERADLPEPIDADIEAPAASEPHEVRA